MTSSRYCKGCTIRSNGQPKHSGDLCGQCKRNMCDVCLRQRSPENLADMGTGRICITCFEAACP